jgi:Lrp/AsnC family leucine-responsive transcriptional regulator
LTITLTDTDIAVLRSLLDDGRKSFRQISKEIGVTTPTVKARFSRLVDMGVIRSVSPILDLNVLRISKEKKDDNNDFEIDNLIKYQEYVTQQLIQTKKDIESSSSSSNDGIILNVKCDHCKTSITNRMYILKFGMHERFFCCDACRKAYKEKYGSRINAIRNKYIKNNNNNN